MIQGGIPHMQPTLYKKVGLTGSFVIFENHYWVLFFFAENTESGYTATRRYDINEKSYERF